MPGVACKLHHSRQRWFRICCVKGPVVEAPGQVSSCLLCSPKTGCVPGPAACPDLHAGPVSGDWPGCTLPVGSGIPELGPQSAVWGLFPPLRPTTSLRPDGADAAPPLPPPSTPPPPGGHWSVSPGGQERRESGALASSGRWDSRSPCGAGRLGFGLWSGQRGPFSGSLSELRGRHCPGQLPPGALGLGFPRAHDFI